jgi:hypothetical protein
MDLLDHVSQKAGDPAQTDRLGMREPEGRQTPALLLAGLPPQIKESAPAAGAEALFFGSAGCA